MLSVSIQSATKDSKACYLRPEEVVKLLCMHKYEKQRTVINRRKRALSGSTESEQSTKLETFWVCEYSKKEHCTNPDRLIYLRKNHGYVNCLSHLRTCLASRDLGILEKMHLENFKRKQTSLDDHFIPSLECTAKETELIS